jgi:hypothetical protein
MKIESIPIAPLAFRWHQQKIKAAIKFFDQKLRFTK